MTVGGLEYYYQTNSIGSIVALTDSTGVVVERYEYTAFGTPTFLKPDGTLKAVQKSDYGNEYLFQGRRYDSETGLYYYRARYYDSGKGRFLSRDPLGYIDSMNLYSAFNSNPLNFKDPWGMSWFSDIAMNTWNFIKGAGKVVAEPPLATADVIRTLWAKGWGEKDVNYWSMSANMTKARIIQGQGACENIGRGLGDVGLTLVTGGGWAVGKYWYEAIPAYKRGELTLAQLKAGGWQIAGGQTFVSGLATTIPRNFIYLKLKYGKVSGNSSVRAFDIFFKGEGKNTAARGGLIPRCHDISVKVIITSKPLSGGKYYNGDCMFGGYDPVSKTIFLGGEGHADSMRAGGVSPLPGIHTGISVFETEKFIFWDLDSNSLPPNQCPSSVLDILHVFNKTFPKKIIKRESINKVMKEHKKK